MAETMTETNPRIYVGTYGKYNAGSLAGKWLDLTDYADVDDFLAACAELHKDEHDPEFMFQDFEGFPRSMYSESPDTKKLEQIYEYLALEDYEKRIFEAYCDAVGDEYATIEDARGNHYGTADSDREFAEQWIEETGMLSEVPESIARHFDYNSFARELMCDFTTGEDSEGTTHYFRS